LLKIGGSLVALVLSFGIFVSVWFIWQVNNGLADLAREEGALQEEKRINQELVLRRGKLLGQEEIEKKGAVLGLFPPDKKQVRRP